MKNNSEIIFYQTQSGQTNITGKLIQIIDLQNAKKGIYILEISIDKKLYFKKNEII